MKLASAALALASSFLLARAWAHEPAAPAKAPVDPAVPLERSLDPKNEFFKRHAEFVKLAKRGGIDLLFLGDSITEGWCGNPPLSWRLLACDAATLGLCAVEQKFWKLALGDSLVALPGWRCGGEEVWRRRYASLHAADFGIGGDRTEHVLWRVQNGELDGISPKVVVLMIGTNNMDGSVSSENIARGVGAVVEAIERKLPKTSILLLGLLPRAKNSNGDPYEQVRAVNALIAKLEDAPRVRYLDFGERFLNADGTISKAAMPDYVHPDAKGYRIWAEAMQPLLDEMMR